MWRGWKVRETDGRFWPKSGRKLLTIYKRLRAIFQRETARFSDRVEARAGG